MMGQITFVPAFVGESLLTQAAVVSSSPPATASANTDRPRPCEHAVVCSRNGHPPLPLQPLTAQATWRQAGVEAAECTIMWH